MTDNVERVIGYGSRSWTNRVLIRERLAELRARCPGVLVVTGGAHGADSMIDDEALKMGFRTTVYPAMWRKNGVYNPMAGFDRNERMAALPNVLACIAFWDGQSHGTRDMLTRAETHGITTEIIRAVVSA